MLIDTILYNEISIIYERFLSPPNVCKKDVHFTSDIYDIFLMSCKMLMYYVYCKLL